MDPLLAVVVAIVALLAGLAVGWWLGARPVAAQAAELAALRDRLAQAETALAAASERAARAAEVQRLLDAVVAERDGARAELASLAADARNFETRLADLAASKDALLAQMQDVGDKLLAKAQSEFLEKAGQKFTEADRQQQQRLTSLLQPVEATLKRYEEGLQRVEKERVDHYAGLKAVVEQVREGQGRVRDETRNLVNALRASPKARGRWGEQTLKNVLEMAGLIEHCDFATEVSVDTGDGRLRPDVIVNLPGGRKLVVDAKCSLNAYLDAADEVDDERRLAHMKAHVGSIRTHATQLGSKHYWAQFEDAADYVVMFIPGEQFLTAALEQDAGLWEWAFERKVLLATPTNLVAIARTVASVWRQEKLASEAGKIAQLGRELHQRLATMADHVAAMGTHLERANGAYNKMVGSLESQVLTQARRFEEFGAASAKELPELSPVQASVRPLTKLGTALPSEAGRPSANEDDAAA